MAMGQVGPGTGGVPAPGHQAAGQVGPGVEGLVEYLDLDARQLGR